MIAIGVGCDRGTPYETVREAVERALQSASLSLADVKVVATIDGKKDEEALLTLASRNHWPLTFYPAEELKKVAVPHPSAVVMKYMGTPSVAEAAALLAAGAGMEDLIVEKLKNRGADGKNATVSLARIKT